MTTTYRVEGMTCGGCAKGVETKLRTLAPSATVTLDPPRAIIDAGDRAPTLSQMNALFAPPSRYRLVDDVDPAPAKVPVSLAAVATYDAASSYAPILWIVGIAAAAAAAFVLPRGLGLDAWMTGFMAGVLIIFALFKLLDVQGFADGFQTYDLLAMRSRTYALAYPFIELALGLALLTGLAPKLVVLIIAVVFGFGLIGVIRALKDGRQLKCACLGTVLNLPLSKVAAAEDASMLVMGLMMLAM